MTLRGLINHQSTVFLFDADTGRVRAMVGGNLLTALRTAGASAVSVQHLARHDAKVLGVVGAGHPAGFQLRAALEQRRFDKVIGWNRTPAHLDTLASVAKEAGVPCEVVRLQDMRAADVIITITSAFAPSLMAELVSIGEAQHAVAEELISETDVAQVGSVINGAHAGRTKKDQITLSVGIPAPSPSSNSGLVNSGGLD